MNKFINITILKQNYFIDARTGHGYPSITIICEGHGHGYGDVNGDGCGKGQKYGY